MVGFIVRGCIQFEYLRIRIKRLKFKQAKRQVMLLATIPVTITSQTATEHVYSCPTGYEVDFGTPAGVVEGNKASDIKRIRLLPQCVLSQNLSNTTSSSNPA